MKRGVDEIGVAVAAVITNNKNECLLLLRNKSPDAGCWSIPGGAVEFSETLESALQRELAEELDIQIDILKLLRVTNYFNLDYKAHWVIPTFLVNITSGTPINKELKAHAQMKWFGLSDLPKNITDTALLGISSLIALNENND